MGTEITLIPGPLPGFRLLGDGKFEEGAMLAFRSGGDELLFVSWSETEKRGLVWIPIAQFSVDPEATMPVGVLEEDPGPGEEGPPGDETAPPGAGPGPAEEEQPAGRGPFGRTRPELTQRP